MIVIQPVEFFQFGPDITNELVPVATSVFPNNGARGTVVNVTVTGINFGFAGTWDFGTGIVTSNILNINSTTTTMTLTISATCPLGFHNLTVTGIAGSSTLVNAFNVFQTGIGDFFDYIFQFKDQGSFLRDPVIQQFAPSVLGSQPGVQLLIYNPVETLQPPVPTIGNPFVLPPQLAQSTVPLPGFWGMLTIQSSAPIPPLMTHPNLQILNDRTMMFRRVPSVLITKIDVSHINIVINIFGVYVTDGLTAATGGQYVGLGDVLGAGSFTAYWGLRAFSFATIGNKAVQLRRSSDSALLDVTTVANGTLDNAAITAFKGTSNLTVAKVYDQTGNGFDLVPSGPTFEQAFTQNFLNGMGVYDNHNGHPTAYRANTTFTILNTWSNCFFSVVKSVAPFGNSFQNIGASGDDEIGLILDRDAPFHSVSIKNEGGGPDGALFDNNCAEMTWHAITGVVDQNTGSVLSFVKIDNQPFGPFAIGANFGNPNNLYATICLWGEDGSGPNSNYLIGYGAEAAWFATPTPNIPWRQNQAAALIANAKAFWNI